MARVLLGVVALVVLSAVAWGVLGPTVHVVERGDTLSKLALRYEVSVPQLRAWNGLSGDLIEVDQWLLVWPGTGATGPAAAPERRTAARRERRRVTVAPRPVPAAGTAAAEPAAPLAMPPPKPCLDGPSGDDVGEAGIASSVGLRPEQARRALDGFLPEVDQRCLHQLAEAPTEALELALTVGCDGQVSRISVHRAGDWPPQVATCVADTLGHTPFPAHDLPEGEDIVYPLRVAR